MGLSNANYHDTFFEDIQEEAEIKKLNQYCDFLVSPFSQKNIF